MNAKYDCLNQFFSGHPVHLIDNQNKTSLTEHSSNATLDICQYLVNSCDDFLFNVQCDLIALFVKLGH